MTTSATDVRSFGLQLTMQTDWHIGSGLERPGAEDRLVRRDADELPFVPAKTLTAMIRDAAEQIAMGQQSTSMIDSQSHDGASRADGGPNLWRQWVLFLFGDQPNRPDDTLYHDRNHSARISIRPAYMADDLRQVLRPVSGDSLENAKRREFREALVFTKPGVRIGRNGQAMKKHLRFDEMVRGGVPLTSSGCHFDCSGLDAEQVEFAQRFLELAVRIVERLGARRRRGSGRVEIALAHGSECKASVFRLANNSGNSIALAKYFEGLPSPPPLPAVVERASRHEASSLVTSGGVAKSDWVRMPIAIQLKTPLMALERTIGNVVKSLDFVPGTMLLSLVARTLRPIWPDVDRAIVAGELRVSPATIDMSSPKSQVQPLRGLPTPACLFHPKGSSDWFGSCGNVSNKLIENNDDHVKDFRDGYVFPSDASKLPTSGKPRKIIAPHSTVDEESQRPTTAVGGVFAYEAIAAGTRLCAEIRLPSSQADEIAKLQPNWWKRLNGAHSLGRSRKDDYGLIEMTPFGPPVSVVPSSGCSENASGSNTITIWLTSDVLLRDSNLRAACTANDLASEIVRALGLTMGDVEPVRAGDAFLRHRRIETWHVGWGLPRTSLVAIAAGSCLRLRRSNGSIFDARSLAKLETNGIGLRRAEGFGMLMVNHRLVTSEISAWEPATSLNSARSAEVSGQIDSTNESLFRRLETEVWRQRILRTSIQIASNRQERRDVLGLEPGEPKPAQAALVRNLLQFGVETTQKKDAVVQRLDHIIELRGNRWPNGALQKIRDLISGRANIGRLLGSENWPRLTSGPDLFESDPGFSDRAVRTLIQAILKTHQSEREKLRSATATAATRSGHGS